MGKIAWFNSDWNFRKKITVDNTKVDANLTDFPVLVDLANLGTDFFSNVKTDGSDIVITSSDGTTQLKRELVSIAKLDQGLISYLKLDESSGNALDSQGSNDATLVNTPTQSATGKINTGYDFDTNDFLRDNNHPTVSNNKGSIALWVKMDNLTGQQAFVGSGNTANSTVYGGFRVEDTTGFITFFMHDGTFTSLIRASSDGITAGSFFHVAVTCDGTTTKLYVNGSEVSSYLAVVGTDGLWFNNIATNTFTYGIHDRSTDFGAIDGTMDEIGIWDRPLSSEEVSNLFNSNSGKPFDTFSSSGTGQLHFKAPTLDVGTDTEFFIYYENAAATETNDTDTWTTNYKAVYHLDESSGSVLDSTVNANTGTNNGATTGAVGKLTSPARAYDFDGSNDFIDMGDVLDTGTGAFTASMWFKTSTTSTVMQMVGKTEAAANPSWEIRIGGSGVNKLDASFRDGATVDQPIGTTTVTDGVFHYVVLTRAASGGNVELYLDGVIEATVTNNSRNTDNAFNFKIGRTNNNLFAFNGTIEETRVLNSKLTSTFISTEFNNQNSPSTFYLIGAQEVEAIILQDDTFNTNDAFVLEIKKTEQDTFNTNDEFQLQVTAAKEETDTFNTADEFSVELKKSKDLSRIKTKIEINGQIFNDYTRLKVNKSMNNFNSASNYVVTYDNPFGRHSNDFIVGQTIEIFADDVLGDTTLLKGIVEKVKFKGQGTSQIVELQGRDFTLRLLDSTVLPTVFTNQEISDIVKSIIGDNTIDITTNNVNVTTTTLKRIAFNQTTVFEALKDLAELAGFYFFVDENKDLNFKIRNAESSGITLDNTNVTRMNSNQTREGMANEIFVYGDRYLSGFQEDLFFDGGSVFTLKSRPHNTLLQISGLPLVGGVLDLTSSPISGTNYLVSFQDKQIVFTSGTEIGNSIPESGTTSSGLVTYDRDIPIVKVGRNNASISQFGLKRKIITDKSIKDPNTASDILKKELEKTNPLRNVSAEIKGWFDIIVGQTVMANLTDFGLSDTIQIISAEYTFDKNRVNSQKVIKLKLDTKQKDITDEITDIRKRLSLIESQDTEDTDTITRLEQSEDTFRVVGSSWLIRERSVTGSAAIYDNPVFGVYSGTGFNVGKYSSGTNAFTDFQTVRSGGFYI